MKVFVISSAVPYRQHGEHGVSAVNVVVHQLLKSLQQMGHTLAVQVLIDEKRDQVTASEQEELRELSSAGVFAQPTIFIHEENAGAKKWIRRLIKARRHISLGTVEDFYPAGRSGAAVIERIHSFRPDVILTVWSPEGLAATHKMKVPKIAYQGDVDFSPQQARFDDPALFPNGGPLARLYEHVRLRQFRHAHLELMKGVDVIANVTAANAEFYRSAGHPGSVYVPNTWIDCGFDVTGPRPAPRPYRIIGHAGYLNRTGSTFALKFLLAELLPELDKVMAGLEFEVVIAGSGKIPTALQPYINHKRIVLKGFVEDFDAELRTSDVFLLLNNAGRYIAAYTRHMVAWSMGLCLIAHANSKKAIPEIEHMENALIAADARELAALVRAALLDADLNARIRRGGRRTFEEHFSSAKVAQVLSRHIERLAGGN